MRLTFHSDPGHGWLQAPRALVDQMGIQDEISSCSYQRADQVYLEEDCDAGLLMEALKAEGIAVSITESNSASRQSRIRNYESYRRESHERQG